MPEIAPVKPLVAVVVHLSSKCYAWWKSTIAQGSEGANARNFVNVSNKKHATLVWGLRSFRRQQDLIEKGVPVGDFGISISP